MGNKARKSCESAHFRGSASVFSKYGLFSGKKRFNRGECGSDLT